MVKDYLISLKNKGNFSWNELSEMSGIPEATIRKIYSGETADPRFETVAKLVSTMGGSLDAVLNDGKNIEIETNAIISLKEGYIARIAEIKASSNEIIGMLRKDKKVLSIMCLILTILFFVMLFVDALVGGHGWIRY